MRGGGVLGLLALAFVGIIIADVLIHPRGVQVAGKTGNTALHNTEQALLGR